MSERLTATQQSKMYRLKESFMNCIKRHALLFPGFALVAFLKRRVMHSQFRSHKISARVDFITNLSDAELRRCVLVHCILFSTHMVFEQVVFGITSLNRLDFNHVAQ